MTKVGHLGSNGTTEAACMTQPGPLQFHSFSVVIQCSEPLVELKICLEEQTLGQPRLLPVQQETQSSLNVEMVYWVASVSRALVVGPWLWGI